MIASITGILQRKSSDHAVVDVGGVGYKAWLSSQALGGLPSTGESVSLLCHTNVREDAIQLFGFVEETERQAFELLITVSGVGPKLALMVLSGMAVQQLVRAIVESDHARLRAISGVGKRTAERLVVELKDRFAELSLTLAAVDSPVGRSTPAEAEAAQALVGLGYKRALAERAIKVAIDGLGAVDYGTEELLRRALVAVAEL